MPNYWRDAVTSKVAKGANQIYFKRSQLRGKTGKRITKLKGCKGNPHRKIYVLCIKIFLSVLLVLIQFP